MKECCSDSIVKENFVIVDTTFSIKNFPKLNSDGTKNTSVHKITAFHKKYKPNSHEFSQEFESLPDDENQKVVTSNSHAITKKTYNNKWKRSSSNKLLYDIDFKLFDGILDGSHESEMSTIQNMDLSNDDQTLNAETVISLNKELLNESKLQQNMVESTELLKQQFNVLQDAEVENEKPLTDKNFLLIKYNKPNNFSGQSYESKFSKQFGSQEKSKNFEVRNQPDISLDTVLNETPNFLKSALNSSVDKSSQNSTLKLAQSNNLHSSTNKENEYLRTISDLSNGSIQDFSENSLFFVHSDGLLTYDKSLRNVNNYLKKSRTVKHLPIMKNNVDYVSDCFSRISKSASNSSNEYINNNSTYWTPLNKQTYFNKLHTLKTDELINATQKTNNVRYKSITDRRTTQLGGIRKHCTQLPFVTHQSNSENLSFLTGNETSRTIFSQNDSFISGVNANNVGSVSTSLLRSKKVTIDKIELETEPDELLNNEELNNTVKFLKQPKLPSNNPKRSISKHNSGVLLKMSSNSFKPENDLSNVCRMSTRSSEQISFNINNVFEKNKLPGILETRTFTLPNSTEKSVTNKTIKNKKSKFNVSYKSTSFSKSLKRVSNTNMNDATNSSIFRNTLSKTSTSAVKNNSSKFPTSNKIKLQAIAEDIANTIRILSFNNRKVNNLEVFKLEDHAEEENQYARSCKNRSFVCTFCSPLSFTRNSARKVNVFTDSPPRSLSKTTTDQSQVKENVKEKFKSLYNKEPWITKRLYKFLVTKLQPKYNSTKYAEKFVKYLSMVLRRVIKKKADIQLCTDMLKYHMARYGIIKDIFDYVQFLKDFIPQPYNSKLMPGWNPETSIVKFDTLKYIIPIMEDEQFLNRVLTNLRAA